MSAVAAALAEMSKWEDVATELYVRGIVGVPEQAFSCPVAKYLAEFGNCAVASDVDDPAAGFVTDFSSLSVDDAEYHLPANVNQFVIDFDNNRYPELDARNVEN